MAAESDAGLNGVEAEGLRDKIAGGPGPDPDWVEQMIEKGQRLKLEFGPTAREDKVMLADGTPLRGVTKVSMEDDAFNGRVVHIRFRNVEVSDKFIELVCIASEEVEEE